MPAGNEFQYTILRLVPSVERGERLNVGVVLYCRRRDFLAARAHIDEVALRAIAADLSAADVQPHLDALCAVAAGDERAGPLAVLPPSERFGWLASPSSTVIQPSPTHTGITEDPGVTLARLFETLVARRPPRLRSTDGDLGRGEL
jgi:hypothetical protein